MVNNDEWENSRPVRGYSNLLYCRHYQLLSCELFERMNTEGMVELHGAIRMYWASNVSIIINIFRLSDEQND